MAGKKANTLNPGVFRKPTLKTIAELCGLDVSTVSRALNGSPEIGEDTKARVGRIAKEIGYVKDPTGLRLRTGRTNVINLVIGIHRDDQMAKLISAIATRLQSTPFQIAIAPVMPDEDPLKAVRRIVEDHMADGIIINETRFHDPRVDYLMERRFPFATHGRDSLADTHPYYDFDNREFARLAMELLYQRGRRTLALLGPPRSQNYGLDTYLGAMESTTAHGLVLKTIDETGSNEALDDLRTAADRFVGLHPECDGYVCSTSAAAFAITAAVERRGMVIGRDVDIVGKGNPAFLKMFRPAMLAFDENVIEAGDFLARAVLQAIRTPELVPMQGMDVPDFPSE